MKGKFKRISLLLVALMSTVTLCAYAKAAEVCTTHKNYYFFSAAETSTSYNSIVANNGIVRSATYFPDPNPNGSYEGHEICLKKGDIYTTDNTNHCQDTWELDSFYQKQKDLANGNPKTGSFNVDNVTEPVTYKYKEEVSTDTNGNKVITTYFKHGKWFKIDNITLDEEEGGTGVNYLDLDKSAIINGTVLPINNISFDTPVNGYIRAQVNRSMVGQTGRSTTFGEDDSFNLIWPSGTTRKTIILPALYYIEYQTCEEKEEPTPEEPTSKKYNITINYLSKEDNKKIADSDYINDVEETFSTTVTPPTVKNCNPDKKTVDVSIKDTNGEAKDRTYNVYYTCKTDASVDTNAKTGDGLIYASIILAFTAIGLGTYYFVVYGKAKKEEA